MKNAVDEHITESPGYIRFFGIRQPAKRSETEANFFTLNLETPVTNMNQGDIAKYKAVGNNSGTKSAHKKIIIRGDVVVAYNNVLTARERIRVYQEPRASRFKRSGETFTSKLRSWSIRHQLNVACATSKHPNSKLVSRRCNAVSTGIHRTWSKHAEHPSINNRVEGSRRFPESGARLSGHLHSCA